MAILIANPIGLPSGYLQNTVMPALQGGVGATGLKVVMGQVSKFLPAAFASPWLMALVKIGVAGGMGIVAEKVSTRAIGRNVTNGAMVGAFDGLFTMLAANFAPTLPLGEWSGTRPGLTLQQWSDAGYDPAAIQAAVARRTTRRQAYWQDNPALAAQRSANHPMWVNPDTEPTPSYNSAHA